jgi:hypothetical protein
LAVLLCALCVSVVKCIFIYAKIAKIGPGPYVVLKEWRRNENYRREILIESLKRKA